MVGEQPNRSPYTVKEGREVKNRTITLLREHQAKHQEAVVRTGEAIAHEERMRDKYYPEGGR